MYKVIIIVNTGVIMQNLSKSEIEALSLLIEECSEVQQAATKILRHGKKSYNPFDTSKTTNINLLEKELSHVLISIDLLKQRNDLDWSSVMSHKEEKLKDINKWLHYNEIA